MEPSCSRPRDPLLVQVPAGLPTKIGEWCFDTMFDLEGRSESRTKPYHASLPAEDLMWFLQDVVEAAQISNLFDASDLLKTIAAYIDEIGALYGESEDDYWKRLKGGGRRKLLAMLKDFCSLREPLSKMRNLYGSEIADRILHDRR